MISSEHSKDRELYTIITTPWQVMLLMEGRAHVYVFASPGCKKWDTCAPQAILEAAGGILTDMQGDLIPYQATVPHRYTTHDIYYLL